MSSAIVLCSAGLTTGVAGLADPKRGGRGVKTVVTMRLSDLNLRQCHDDNIMTRKGLWGLSPSWFIGAGRGLAVAVPCSWCRSFAKNSWFLEDRGRHDIVC